MSDLGAMADGIMLALDDKLREKCIGLVDEKMAEVCGGLENCDPAFEKDDNARFTGAADFGMVRYSDGAAWSACKQKNPDDKCADYPKAGVILIDEYVENAGRNQSADEAGVRKELENASARIDAVIGKLEDDPRVSWCVNGRPLGQIAGAGSTTARYPDLTQRHRRTIAAAGLKKFRQK
jgi:hypothetical protein